MNLNEFPSTPYEGQQLLIGNVTYQYTGGVWNVVSAVKTNLRVTAERLAKEAGFSMVAGSFDSGATVTNPADVIWDEFSGKYYSWSGSFGENGKQVPPSSTPATPGGIGAGAWVDRTDETLRGELASTTGAGLVGYQPVVTGAVATTVQSKLREFVSVKDFGAVGDGITDDTAAVLAFLAAVDNPILDRIVTIGQNITINTNHVAVKRGGGFLVNSGVLLTINSDIDAGHYQIFFGQGEVLPSFWTQATPAMDRPRTTHVKAAWFGVINDGRHPATKGTPTEGTNAIGDQPTGTDSTEAMKKAVKFVQYASFKAMAFDELNTICPLVLQPNSKIILKGGNPLGSQVMLSEISRMRNIQASGGNFSTDPDYQALRNSSFDYKIIGNFATILFVPKLNTNALIGETININQIYVDDILILPVGFTGSGWGRLLKNETLLYAGNTGREIFFNSLAQQHFNNVRYSIPSGSVTHLGVNGATNPSQNVFTYEGYALGDRLRVVGGEYRNFTRMFDVRNAEAVEFLFEHATTASYFPGTVWYNFPQNYSQFRVENVTHLMKAADQILLNFIADYSGPFQSFASAARVQLRDCRAEGATNAPKTLINANYGQFTIENFDSNNSVGVEPNGSICAILSRLATAEFKNCVLPNRFKVNLAEFNGSNPTIDPYAGSLRTPMLSFKSCAFSGDGGRDAIMLNSTFNGVDYLTAINQIQSSPSTVRVPVVEFEESGNLNRAGLYGYYVPFCKYYGTFNVPFNINTHTLYAPVSKLTGAEYATTNSTGWQFPPYARITGLYVTLPITASNFSHIMIKIGQDSDPQQFSRIFSLASITGDTAHYTRKWNNLNLIVDTAILTQTGDPEKLHTRLYFSDEVGNIISNSSSNPHPPSRFVLEYTAIRSPAEVIAINTPAANSVS